MNNPEGTTRPRARRWWLATAAAVLLIVAAGSAWYAFGRDDHDTASTTADAAMAAAAQQVMPFDLNRTTHTFIKTAAGGVEKVVVNETADTRDRDLIRSHLQTEAEHFRQGNYSDPAKIHGMDMPGVNELQQDHGQSQGRLCRDPRRSTNHLHLCGAHIDLSAARLVRPPDKRSRHVRHGRLT